MKILAMFSLTLQKRTLSVHRRLNQHRFLITMGIPIGILFLGILETERFLRFNSGALVAPEFPHTFCNRAKENFYVKKMDFILFGVPAYRRHTGFVQLR